VWPAAVLSGMRAETTASAAEAERLGDASSQRLGVGASSRLNSDSGIELISSASSSSASDSWLAQVPYQIKLFNSLIKYKYVLHMTVHKLDKQGY